MAIHQLAVFWRDEQARYFTAWHFQPPQRERASQRAQKILSAITQLSMLQIYGAVLDTIPLRLEAVKTAPTHGTETRLEVSLRPTAKSKVGGGQIRFSLPGPTEALCRVVTEKLFSAPEWQLLEQELLPYLCSPSGIEVSVSPDHVEKAQIANLDLEQRPQLTEAPLSAPIARTLEAIEVAKQAYQQNQTEKLYQRREKYQRRLELLQKLQELEQKAFSSLSQLKTFTAREPAYRAAKATTVSTLIKGLMPNIEELKSSIRKEVSMTPSSLLPAETPFLPSQPTTEASELWKDVQHEHFSLPELWTHRTQIRELYGLNERTYYRWINELKAYGLNRSLSAQGNARVTLFYRPDFDHAVQLSQAASRTRKTKAAHREDEDSSSIKAVTTPAQIGFIASQLASLSNSLADLAAQQKALSQAIVRLESNLAEQRQADLSKINQHLNSLNQKQAEMAAQLPQAHLVSLISQLISLNQLPKALQKLNTNVRKLAEPKAQPPKKTRAKGSSKTSKSKKRKKI